MKSFMKSFMTQKVCLVCMSILTMFVILPGCGVGVGGGGRWDKPSIPAVSATSPANGETDVAILSKFTAVFSEAIDPATITTTTFTVMHGTTAVPGVVTYSGVTAVFTPTNPLLAPNAAYTCAITTGVKNPAGRKLPRDYVWSFTTGALADTVAPTVSVTSPTNTAVAVPVNRQVKIAFSEAMDPATITTASFAVTGPGGVPVSGTVVSVGTSATFTPTGNLANSSLYTATVTSGVKDLANNSMAHDFVFTFTTGAVADSIAPMVSVTSPTNTAVEVPSNRKVTIGFSEAMDPLSITPASFTMTSSGLIPFTVNQVPGTVTSVGTTATFTPSSNLPAGTTYTVTVAAAAKDLAGNAMAQDFVFTFTTHADVVVAIDSIKPTVSFTSPTNTAIEVPVNRKVNVAFSETMDPLTITALTVKMTDSGLIPVAGTVSYVGTTATFIPLNNLATNTNYICTITSGVKDLAGNAMASDFVFTFTTHANVVVAIDSIKPTVSFTSPTNAAVEVPVNRKINVAFSEAMDPLTVTAVSFKMTDSSLTPVAGTVSYVGTTATFIPLNNLATNTGYICTITNAVTDLAGNTMASDFVFTFTTAVVVVADSIAPTVSVTSPTNTAVEVPVNRKVNVGFSEAMDPLTLTTVTFKMTDPGLVPVAGTVSLVGTTATFIPLTNLALNTKYTVTITNGVKDLAGNAMVNDFVFTFTTHADAVVAIDSIAPKVNFTSPTNGSTAVPFNRKVNAAFSEAMDPLTINAVTFKMTDAGLAPVTGTVSYIDTTATFIPLVNLAANTTYTCTITTGTKDLAGNALASAYVWSFTTSALLDTTLPTIIATINANGATNVPFNSKAGATFSEAMDPLTITSATFTFTQGGLTVPGVVSYSGVDAVFTPTSALAPGTTYTATITTGAKDLAGNAVASNYVWSWTTGAAPDTTKPTVILVSPADLDTGVAINSAVHATFSEAMDPLTITNLDFTVAGVPGTVTYNAITRIATFTPTSNLATGTSYTATVSTGVKDLAGNTLAANKVWSFTTVVAPIVVPVVDLGAAAPFGGFGGGAGMTNQGIFTVINGDIGTTGASTLITGFHDTGGNVYTETPLNSGKVNGTIYTATAPPASSPGAIASAGALAAQTAYIKLSPAALPGGIDVSSLSGGAGELGGRTLAPGVYKSAPGSFNISLGNLTLDAGGNGDAFWVFQMASSLTVGIAGPTGARSVILINGAQAKNVFWQVGSAATINAAGGGTMVGTIIASSGAAFSTAGNVVITTLEGRVMGLNASVTLVNTHINVPAP